MKKIIEFLLFFVIFIITNVSTVYVGHATEINYNDLRYKLLVTQKEKKYSIYARYRNNEYYQDHGLYPDKNEGKSELDLSGKYKFMSKKDIIEYFQYVEMQDLHHKSFEGNDVHAKGKSLIQEVWSFIQDIKSLSTKNIAVGFIDGNLLVDQKNVPYIFISAPCQIDSILVKENEKITKQYNLVDIDPTGSIHHKIFKPAAMQYLGDIILKAPNLFDNFEKAVFEYRNVREKNYNAKKYRIKFNQSPRHLFYGYFGHAEQAILSYVLSEYGNKGPLKLDIVSRVDLCPMCIRYMFILSNKNRIINAASLYKNLKKVEGESPYFHLAPPKEK